MNNLKICCTTHISNGSNRHIVLKKIAFNDTGDANQVDDIL